MKKCSKCNQLKNKSEFHKHSRNKDGLRNDCKECRQKETKEYRTKYREKVLEKKKQWYKDTKKRKEARTENALSKRICTECGEEKLIKEFRQRSNGGYYAKCRDCENKLNKEYRKTHIDVVRKNRIITEQRRRTKAKNVKSNFSIEEWKKCKSFFENTCAYCGRGLNNLTQDHFIPLSKGGDYTKHNILPSCRSCNSKKHDKDFYEWYKMQPNYSLEKVEKIEEYFKSLK